MEKTKCALFLSITDRGRQDELWQVYQNAFSGCVENCIQDQICFNKATFRAALEDTEYFKFVLEVNGKPAGFLLTTDNLEKARVAYVNPDRLKKVYPTEFKEKRLWYVIILAIDPTSQGSKYAQNLVETAVIRGLKDNVMWVFDFSTEKNSALPQMLLQAVRKTLNGQHLSHSNSGYTALGGQEYGVIRTL